MNRRTKIILADFDFELQSFFTSESLVLSMIAVTRAAPFTPPWRIDVVGVVVEFNLATRGETPMLLLLRIQIHRKSVPSSVSFFYPISAIGTVEKVSNNGIRAGVIP
ncbi:hypothetical protein Droror1_Dr00001821 [Drosera rotundifolia]